MNQRVFNFGAGPAMLPLSVLNEAQAELLNWQGHGMSIMEIGHRTNLFMDLMQRLEALFIETLDIPQNYRVLFLGGAARTQFAMVPLNLIREHEQAGYLVSGIWSEMAYLEALKLKNAYCIASSEGDSFKSVPTYKAEQILQNTSFVYYTPNETINGVAFRDTPDVLDIPLVADMTSCLLSEPLSVADFGLIFAGAQKNIAPAGLTVVIIREDLLDRTKASNLPTMLNYQTHSAAHSLYATPPTFNCYMALKMLEWIKSEGGVSELYKENCKKAAALYDFIDKSEFYSTTIAVSSRSIMNVCFSLSRPELESSFLESAEKAGLVGLKGHRLVGGLRASLYNAMPMSGVTALIEFMQRFQEEKHEFN